MKLSRLAALGTAAALAFSLSACGGDDGDGGKAGEDPAKITAWFMGAANEPQDKVLAQAKADFRQKHPKTDVEVVYVPWPDATKKLQDALNTGQGPDVVEIGNDQAVTWAGQDALADITKRFAGWSEGKDVVKGSLELGQVDGKTYAVPWYAGVRVVWYRKDLFAEHGVQPPKTWDELKAAAKRIQDAEGGDVAGIAAPSDFTNGFASFLWGAGGEIAVQEGGKWAGKLDTPESKKAVEYYTGLVKEGLAPKKYIGVNELAGPQRDFANGKVAMYIDGAWTLPQIEKISKKHTAQMGAFTIPTPTGQVGPAFAGGSHLAVWKDSKHPAAAFDYLTSVTSKKNAKTFADELKFFPQFSDLLSGGGYSGDPIQGPAAAQMANVKGAPKTPNWTEADQNKKIIPTMLKEVMNGTPVDQAVAKANKDLTDTLNQG
ncbi:extracellular solute-binding protein [Actinomadura viridis]|uniref:N,N'-diacetylchitobiose transport system substrate-binding protein n=1 Tax=Actinomadura viridis TaxID=58110 RepID=A0A931DI73_9ACTN|nr:extracellular solute-binding protein [Actinomadura viridis]MBG6087971.1 N,N'-diacetylchitobiose transport system substrate-binding protein [Actinomadura viridis]